MLCGAKPEECQESIALIEYEGLTPQEIANVSRTRWAALPEVHQRGQEAPPDCGDLTTGVWKKPKFRGMPMSAIHRQYLGTSRGKRLEAFLKAAEEGVVPRVKALLEAGVDINCQNEYRFTPVMIAAWKGHAEVVKAIA